MSLAEPTGMAGTWESREGSRGAIRIRDHAMLWTPIPVDLNAPTHRMGEPALSPRVGC